MAEGTSGNGAAGKGSYLSFDEALHAAFPQGGEPTSTAPSRATLSLVGAKALFEKVGSIASIVVGTSAALILGALLIRGIVGMVHRDKDPESLLTAAATEGDSTWCVTTTAGPFTTSKGGDTTTPLGVLAEMEHQYFGRRDAAGVIALTSGNWATESSVAASIERLPEGSLEWCTRIFTQEEGWYTVAVTWRRDPATLPPSFSDKNKVEDSDGLKSEEDPAKETTWIGDYRVEGTPDQGYRITGLRINEQAVEQARKEEEERKAREASHNVD